MTTAPDLWCHNDEEEDAELNTLCHARQGEMPIEVDIDNI
jgi:hypothetical protein